MATPNANAHGDGTELNNRTFAAYLVTDEHRRLSEALMAAVDMIGAIQDGREDARRLNVANLRKGTSLMLYKSRRDLIDGLLFAIAVDDKTPLDEKVIDAIADSGDEAGKHYERLDAEIKAETQGES